MSENQEPISIPVVRAAIRLRSAASNLPKRQHQLRKLVAEHPQMPAGCVKPERLYTPLTLVRLPRRRWWDRHLETLLDVVVVAAVAGLVWLALTDKDESGAETRAATAEVQSHE